MLDGVENSIRADKEKDSGWSILGLIQATEEA